MATPKKAKPAPKKTPAKKTPKTNKKAKAQTEEVKEKKNTSSINLFGRRKEGGVITMTQQASEMADETVRSSNGIPARYDNCIIRFGDK